MWLFFHFNFERSYDVLKSKSSCIFLIKNINFNKNPTESKMENPTQVFRETNLVLQLTEESQMKVKLLWIGARERKERAFFVSFILSEGNFFKICVLYQCIVYWIHFQSIRTFAYQKTLLYTLLLLVFKIVESLQCILKERIF